MQMQMLMLAVVCDLSHTAYRVEHSLVVRRQDTRADITMCTWAPNKTYTLTQFVSLHTYCTHCYTQAIARCTTQTMAVASSEGCLLLDLGTTAGGVFVVADAAEKALVWVALDTGSCKGTVKRCTHVL